MLLLPARSPAPVRNRVRRFFLFLGSVLLLGGAGLLVAMPDATAVTAISGTATPDKLDTDIQVSTEWVSGIYTFSFSPASGWTWYGDQGAWAGWSGRVDILYQWLSGIITMPIGVTDCFESEYWGNLTPTGTGTTTPITKQWHAYAWDHIIDITTDPVYVRVADTSNTLTREGPTSATLNAVGPTDRVDPPAWSAGSVTGLSFSPTAAWTTTCSNSSVATGQPVTITATSQSKKFPNTNTTPSSPPAVTMQLKVVDVNIASSTVEEKDEDATAVLVPVLAETASSGGVPVSLSVAPTMAGTATLEKSSSNFDVYNEATLSTALLGSTQTTATCSVPKTVYIKGVTASANDTLTLSFTPSAQTGGSTPPEFKDSIKVTVVKVNLKSVDFLGTGNHTLRKQGTDAWSNDKFGDNGDVIINYPEWQDNDLDGTADIDDPVCYTQSSCPNMTAVLAVSPNLSTAVTAKLRVKKGSTELVAKDITLSGSETTVSDLAWAATSALPATLLTSDYALTWSISLDAGSTYCDIGISVNRFFVVLGIPGQVNSYGSGNNLTCKRISEVLDNAGTTANVGTIAANIQTWRDDYGINNTGATTGVNGAKIWALLDFTEKGQCGEGFILMEQAVRLLGVPAEYQHVFPAISLPVPVHSAASSASAPTREHDSTTENLYMYFTAAGAFTGWNVGEGCCLVGGKLYAAWAGYRVGESGGVVNGKTAASAAHHILMQLSDGMPDLQRWRKANGDACDSGDTVPVP